MLVVHGVARWRWLAARPTVSTHTPYSTTTLHMSAQRPSSCTLRPRAPLTPHENDHTTHHQNNQPHWPTCIACRHHHACMLGHAHPMP